MSAATPPRDGLLDDVLALCRARELDLQAFSDVLNDTDCVEHHKLIIRLVELLCLQVPDLDDLARLIEAMQVGEPS